MAKPEMSKRFRRRHGRDKDIKLQEKHTITHGLVESTSNTDPNWTSVEIIFAGFVVGCLVIALGSAFHLRSATYSALQQNWLPRNEYDSVFTYSTVRTVFVPEENITNAEFYKTFATDSGNPVLLKKSLLHRWSAFTKWTPDFLEHVFPSVQVYEQNKTSEFITFHDGKPLERFLTNEKWSDFNGLHNFSSKAVLSNSGPPWLYFSSNLLHLREDYPYGSGVTNDVDPLYPLVVNDSGLQANLWMGSKGIETFMHLDASFNFFAQLHGRKRFTLVPPHVPMYPWSCLHPHIHHAQVPWKQHHNRSALQSKFPDFAASHPSAVVVDVGRGDLLYVPPYWWHHVETLESPSVAVNVWTDAPAYLRIHEVYEHPVPLNADDTDAARIVSVVRFLTMLVSRTELCPLHQNAAEPSDSLLRDWCTVMDIIPMHGRREQTLLSYTPNNWYLYHIENGVRMCVRHLVAIVSRALFVRIERSWESVRSHSRIPNRSDPEVLLTMSKGAYFFVFFVYTFEDLLTSFEHCSRKTNKNYFPPI
eukprot:m.286605 g.286605  ORF g.286605 m.286605 type:complete len:532 (+) comp19933_c0_seq8:183-1778(+)